MPYEGARIIIWQRNSNCLHDGPNLVARMRCGRDQVATHLGKNAARSHLALVRPSAGML